MQSRCGTASLQSIWVIMSQARHRAIPSNKRGYEDKIKSRRGDGAAAVLVKANTGKACQAALDFVAPLCTVVCVGITGSDHKVSFRPSIGINKGVRVIGSAVGTRKDTWEAIEFVQRGAVNPAVEMATLDDPTDIAKNFWQGKWLQVGSLTLLTLSQISGKYVIRLGEVAKQHANGA